MASYRYPLINCKPEKVACIWWASLQSEKTSTFLLRPLTANYCPAVAAIKQFYCSSLKAEPLPRNVPHVLVLFSTTRICIYLRADVAAKMSTFKLLEHCWATTKSGRVRRLPGDYWQITDQSPEFYYIKMITDFLFWVRYKTKRV